MVPRDRLFGHGVVEGGGHVRGPERERRSAVRITQDRRRGDRLARRARAAHRLHVPEHRERAARLPVLALHLAAVAPGPRLGRPGSLRLAGHRRHPTTPQAKGTPPGPPELGPSRVSIGTSRATWHDEGVNGKPTGDRLRDLARLRRVRDRIDREYAQPLDVEALARGEHMSAGHLSRQFRVAFGESPYSYLMTRRIERAMALLRRGDLTVTEICFEVGCSSLGTFSTRFTELVGVPPSVYRDQAAGEMAGIAPCVVKQVTRPVRNREAPQPSHT